MRVSLKIYMGLFFILTLCMLAIAFKKNPYPIYISHTEPVLAQSMNDVNAKRFDKEGKLTQIVNMQSWVQYQGQATSQISMPLMKLFHADGGIWQISAQKGEGFQIQNNSKLEKLHLSDDVFITRTDESNEPGWKLKTQELTFFPGQPSAMTDSPVIVNGPGIEIHALGMRTDFKQHQVELLKEVTTHYVSPQA